MSVPARPEQSHEYVPIYPSLQIESIASSGTSDFGLDLYLGAPDVKGHPYELHETLDDSSVIVPNLVTPISPNQYKPLQFPPILHEFPAKYYKYLPKFDGESEDLTAGKHIQDFENFSDLFEIEHDDVYMQTFVLSLQGDAKV